MVNDALKRLYVVQQLDTKMAQLKHRLLDLDKGEAEKAESERATAAREEAEARYKQLHSEVTDAELELKSVEEKKQKYEKRLFEGTIVNPRELDGTRKEVEMLCHMRERLDEKILALWDEVETQKRAVETAKKAGEDAAILYTEKLRQYQRRKAAIEQEYKQTALERQKAVHDVDPRMVKRYDYTRQRHGGIGVAPVREKTCSACGTTLPVSQFELLHKGSAIVTCEACARLLFIE